MFDQNELDQIALVVGKVIEEKVPPIVREIVQEEISSVMEHQIMPQFDLIHGRIDSLESRFDSLDARVDRMDRKITTQIASKSWTEERLDRFSADHRLQYKPAM
ncbi:MAG: hypothetical protein WC813_04985 [Patescibacteria group bacterium]|jgi:hypothetical protein